MPDALAILIGILVAATVYAAFEYYRLLRKTQGEYEKAKEIVEDVVLSFDRELKRENERIEIVAFKVEGVASKNQGTMSRIDNVEEQLHTLETKATLTMEARDGLLAKLNETSDELRDIITSQETLTSRITRLEEQTKHTPPPTETSVEAAITIRRDKALAPLTQTELSALELFASEGPKTAPEIKERIKLSREHTARLMKKLYESGYLERDTNKIPFKYNVKKEMEKLLKKPENEAT